MPRIIMDARSEGNDARLECSPEDWGATPASRRTPLIRFKLWRTHGKCIEFSLRTDEFERLLNHGQGFFLSANDSAKGGA